MSFVSQLATHEYLSQSGAVILYTKYKKTCTMQDIQDLQLDKVEDQFLDGKTSLILVGIDTKGHDFSKDLPKGIYCI